MIDVAAAAREELMAIALEALLERDHLDRVGADGAVARAMGITAVASVHG